ncbi:shikimate dehydrogenase [Asaia krungthepensis]|uniref:Shikimate dehydrogenase (NADP(+)) n=1 Tax=Asaia krungthepensis NRIC 0535 TaxID=1307925 RepID=A0ABQ0Q5C1_9PROT|nr:shikimate dehydrogenase [Asaia krungthepensis]GBQ92228.1 shikimate 5-dehydrogenase [Asaia krungthepensis NRIC 0535]
MGTETGAAIAALLERHLNGEMSFDQARVALDALFTKDLYPQGRPVLAAVTGWPLTYTRSPILHNGWCAHYGINGLYLRLPLKPENFERGVRALQALGFAGLNVTIPHKEAAYALVDRHTHDARRAGAVNTLVFEADGSIEGGCTDGIGYLDSLREAGVTLPRRALVLGAGGAARAVCAALLDAGCRVTLANRTKARAEALSAALGGGHVIDWQDWPDHLAEAELLTNTTSLGMTGQDVFDWAGSLTKAAGSLVVSDIVYVPLETPLLAAAQARGLATVDGLGMLIHQARPGFEAWFGRRPEVTPGLRARLIETLD